MADAFRKWYESLLLDSVLDRYQWLRVAPSRGTDLLIRGRLGFKATGPTGEVIEDEYKIEITVSPAFPVRIPLVRETGGRIALNYHKLEGNFLCLGAATTLRLQLRASPTLMTFVERIVIPYLYGHSYFQKHGTMPFGELGHGDAGILAEIAGYFGAREGAQPEEFLRLAGLQKRRANRQACPCGSGWRLGRCHHRQVNSFRGRMGRLWCRDEYERVVLNLTSRRKSTGRLSSIRAPQSASKRIEVRTDSGRHITSTTGTNENHSSPLAPGLALTA